MAQPSEHTDKPHTAKPCRADNRQTSSPLLQSLARVHVTAHRSLRHLRPRGSLLLNASGKGNNTKLRPASLLPSSSFSCNKHPNLKEIKGAATQRCERIQLIKILQTLSLFHERGIGSAPSTPVWASPVSRGVAGARSTLTKLRVGEISPSSFQQLICALQQVHPVVQMNTASPASLLLVVFPPKIDCAFDHLVPKVENFMS